MDEREIFLSIANAIITCSLIALSILDSLEDAPPIEDVVRIELSRLFTLPGLQTEFPEYKQIVDAKLARDILAEPFFATTPTKMVVQDIAGRISKHASFRVDAFLQTMFTEAVGSDPTVYSILRRGLSPISDPETVVKLIDEMNGEFGIDIEDNMEAVVDMYRSVYYQLVR